MMNWYTYLLRIVCTFVWLLFLNIYEIHPFVANGNTIFQFCVVCYMENHLYLAFFALLYETTIHLIFAFDLVSCDFAELSYSTS